MAMLLSEVITERVRRFKNQIYLAGVRGPLYWGTQAVTDFLYFIILAVVIISVAAIVNKLNFPCAFALVFITLYQCCF